MIKKIKRILLEHRVFHKENKKLHSKNLNLLQELDWANIYHDSIRGKDFLENLPLNIGRWAGNYSFFYVLNRVLNDFKPNKILEFGLGESTKFVSAYLDNYLFDTSHLIIEQDELWKNSFKEFFKLSSNSEIKICPLTTINVNGYEVNSYSNIEKEALGVFDLYIVDGPFGSNHFSRYDIVNLMQNITCNDEFILILDDSHRNGEQETINTLNKLFKKKKIDIYQNSYIGSKGVHVFGTKKYKYIQSL